MLIKQDDSCEKVVLVDQNNRSLGVMDKLRAHQDGALHRAFSVFIFNHNRQMLLQQRASSKYHSPGEWANACCGHPREHEGINEAAQRRLGEEMGISTPLTSDIAFIYQAPLANNMIEHELVQFFVSVTNDSPQPNPHEVQQWLWVSEDELFTNVRGLELAPWFKLYLSKYADPIRQMFVKA